MEAITQFHPRERSAVETFEVPHSIAYNWDYASPRQRLNRRYENAKRDRDRWNRTYRLDCSLDVDPERGLLPILQYEHEAPSDVDHDIEFERRIRAGEIDPARAA